MMRLSSEVNGNNEVFSVKTPRADTRATCMIAAKTPNVNPQLTLASTVDIRNCIAPLKSISGEGPGTCSRYHLPWVCPGSLSSAAPF